MQSESIYSYCEDLSTPHSRLLADLYRESHLKTMQPRMVSGPVQGRLLSLISKLIRPKNILEIGTFTGYATLCLAEGLASDGRIITIEVNPELAFISDKYFELSDYSSQIVPMVGDAKEIIPALDEAFDLVFIDAKKQDYIAYYDLIIEKVNSGGLILADNVLWNGKVLQEKHDKTTASIHAFNQKMLADDRVENIIIPIRDGINAIRKN